MTTRIVSKMPSPTVTPWSSTFTVASAQRVTVEVLNALGQRLTRDGKLSEGEFDFDKLPGMGGAEEVSDVPAGDLLKGLLPMLAAATRSG